MAIVKAKYFRVKIGDPAAPEGSKNAVREVPFLLVPQAPGHSEKEIQVSEDLVKDIKEGEYMDVDTHNLPYLREVAVGDPVGKMSDQDKDDIAKKVAALLGK